jgi:hypothetical protein
MIATWRWFQATKSQTGNGDQTLSMNAHRLLPNSCWRAAEACDQFWRLGDVAQPE